MAEITGETRGRYPHFLAIPTRWIDNDIYGHVNNVRYYEFFDTVINRYLIEVGGRHSQRRCDRDRGRDDMQIPPFAGVSRYRQRRPARRQARHQQRAL